MTPAAPPAGVAGAHLRPAALALLLTGAVAALALVAARRALDRQGEALLPRAFEQKSMGLAFQRRALERDSLVMLYGSSELNQSVPYRAGDWFRSAPTGFRVVPVGRKGTLPIHHAQSFYALGAALRGKRIVIEVAPNVLTHPDGFFTRGMFAGNFSPLAAGAVAWGPPTDTLARRIAHRILDFPLALEADPLLQFGLVTVADGRPGDRAFAVLFRPLGRLQGAVLGLEDEIRLWGAGWVARRKRLQPAAEPGPPDWPRLAAAAESLYRTEAASNPYGIEDRYFLARRSYFESKRTHAPPVPDLDTLPAWQDLELELDLLLRAGARPLVVNVPYMGRLMDYRGSTPEERQEFYDHLRAACARRGVPVVTFEEHDMDQWFLRDDGGHQSPKGWVYTNQALDAFYHDRLR